MTKATKQISKLFAAMVLAGVASHSFAADTIKIGIAGPKTGRSRSIRRHAVQRRENGHRADQRQRRRDGKKLEAVEYDDACDPKQAVAIANKVVNDGVKFVVGHLCSSSTQPASDIYEDEGIIMVTPAATSPDITNRGYKMVFRTIGLDSAQGPTAGNYIADHVKPKIVAVIHDKQQYGEGIATAVKKTLEGKDVKVAVFEGINAGDKDFSSLIAETETSQRRLRLLRRLPPGAGSDPASGEGKRPESRLHGPRRRG